MSYLSPFECLDIYTFSSIIKKLVRKDADGNLYIGAYGLGTHYETLGDDEWRFGCDTDGHFTVDNNVPPWISVFEV